MEKAPIASSTDQEDPSQEDHWSSRADSPHRLQAVSVAGHRDSMFTNWITYCSILALAVPVVHCFSVDVDKTNHQALSPHKIAGDDVLAQASVLCFTAEGGFARVMST